MGLNLPGVGGGFLAAAGAVGGAGQGLAEVGKEQMKADLASKMNDLQQKREEAITRLQGQQQSGLEEQRAGHEKERVGEEIAGKSAVAQFERGSIEHEAGLQREFAGGEGEKNRASRESIAAGHDVSRVASAKAHAPAVKPPKGWAPKNVTLQGNVVNGQIIPGKQMQVMGHPDGSAYVQVGDRLIPYNGASPDGMPQGFQPESLRRAPAKEVQTLLQNPTAVLPSGMTARDSFVKRNGYLPTSFMAAENAARQSAQPQGASGGGGGIGDAATAPENEDPSESESETPAQ